MSLFESGVRPEIDKYLLERASERRDYGDYWSASSAGYCMRKNIFERLKVPYVREDARKQRVFEAGHIFHSWVQGITKNAGVSVAQELELKNEKLKVIGHADDLIKIGDDLILYDYKTQSSRAFNYKRAEMSHFHKMQLGTYLYMLRKNSLVWNDRTFNKNAHNIKFDIGWLKDIKEARICKISKDDLRMTEEQLLYTPELEKEVLEYWEQLNQRWESKLMPPCTCANREGGFMAKEAYNPFYYNEQPCSLDWYNKYKEKSNGK